MSKESKLAGFSTTFDAGISTFKNTTINDTGFLRLPTGTTALRPSAGISTQGMMRYNTTVGKFEGYKFYVVDWNDVDNKFDNPQKYLDDIPQNDTEMLDKQNHWYFDEYSHDLFLVYGYNVYGF